MYRSCDFLATLGWRKNGGAASSWLIRLAIGKAINPADSAFMDSEWYLLGLAWTFVVDASSLGPS